MPQLIICMGVSGSGKSTLGLRLAQRFRLEFFEADDYHSEENKNRMSSGLPLTDAMREPWINALCQRLEAEAKNGNNCILAYSGLRRAHRQRFRELGFRTLFLYLHGDKELIAARAGKRSGHFMPASLLESQIASMQPVAGETDVVFVDIGVALAELEENCAERVQQFNGA